MQLPENGGILKGKYHTFIFRYNYIYSIVIQRYVNDTHNSVNMFIIWNILKDMFSWMSLLLRNSNAMHIIH